MSMTGTALNKYIFYSYLDSVILHQKHRLKDSIREGQILLLLCFENTQVKENCLTDISEIVTWFDTLYLKYRMEKGIFELWINNHNDLLMDDSFKFPNTWSVDSVTCIYKYIHACTQTHTYSFVLLPYYLMNFICT